MICLHQRAMDDSFAAVLTLVHLWLVDTSSSDYLSTSNNNNVAQQKYKNSSGSPLREQCTNDTATGNSSEVSLVGGGGDRQGVCMSIALIPCVLLSGIDDASADDAKQRELSYYYYSAMIAILALFEWSRSLGDALAVLLSAYLLQCFCRGNLWDSRALFHVDDGTVPMVLLMGLFWWIIGSLASSLRRSFTRGEFFVARSLASIAVTEFLICCCRFLEDEPTNVIFGPTAAAGVFGCAAACTMVDHVPFTKERILWRLAFLAITTLGTVEIMFWIQNFDAYAFPRCLNWIFLDFLMQSETPKEQDGLPHWLIGMPRIGWLGYWGLVMIVTIPLAPGTNHAVNPIVARKWFHFIAILLFVPATIWAPQMQSLSYAVAFCVLMIIETTRRHVKWLNAFYKTYLDHSNKNEGEETTIVSHIALILGCAAPLWLWQWQCRGDDDGEDRITITLWGVYVLGVGDSMAAIIGKAFGRHQWINQRRTVEGSLAMALSLGMILLRYNQTVQRERIRTAVLFSTLMEACTFQIDNVVLPLVGYAIIAAR